MPGHQALTNELIMIFIFISSQFQLYVRRIPNILSTIPQSIHLEKSTAHNGYHVTHQQYYIDQSWTGC